MSTGVTLKYRAANPALTAHLSIMPKRCKDCKKKLHAAGSICKYPSQPFSVKKVGDNKYQLTAKSPPTLEGGILAFNNKPKTIKTVSKKRVTEFRQWLRCLQYFNYKCAYCEIPLNDTNLTRDHFIPRSKGGSKAAGDNIVPCCARCNNRKDNELPEKWCTEFQLEKIYTYIWDFRFRHRGHKVEWQAIQKPKGDK